MEHIRAGERACESRMSVCDTHCLTGANAIRDWIVDQLSLYMGLPKEDVRPGISLEQLGLDSVLTLQLLGELSKATGCELTPSVLQDNPTIEDLARLVAEAIDSERIPLVQRSGGEK